MSSIAVASNVFVRSSMNAIIGKFLHVRLGIAPIDSERWSYLPMSRRRHPKPEAQIDRFIETARALECDEDKERFEENLDDIAKAKPTLRKKADDG